MAADPATVISLGRHGSIQHPNDDSMETLSLRYYGEWAEAEIRFLAAFVQRGSNVVDIGAGVGNHALAFAEAVGSEGSVIAVENNERAAPMLSANLLRSGYRQVRMVRPSDHAWLADDDGDPFDLASCALVRVAAARLPPPVAASLAALIRRTRPVIIQQLGAQSGPIDAIDQATSDAFDVLRVSFPAFNPANYRANPSNRLGQARIAGLLYVPRDRAAEIPPASEDFEVEALPDAAARFAVFSSSESERNHPAGPGSDRTPEALEALAAELRRTKFRSRSLDLMADRFAQELAECRLAASHLGAALTAAEGERDRTRTELDGAREEIAAMVNSTSWRATAGLRAIRSKVKGPGA